MRIARILIFVTGLAATQALLGILFIPERDWELAIKILATQTSAIIGWEFFNWLVPFPGSRSAREETGW